MQSCPLAASSTRDELTSSQRPCGKCSVTTSTWMLVSCIRFTACSMASTASGFALLRRNRSQKHTESNSPSLGEFVISMAPVSG